MVNTSFNRLLVPVTSRLCCLCCCLVWWDSLECVIAHCTIDLFFCVWSGSSNPRSSNTLIKDILQRRRSGDSLKAVQIFTYVLCGPMLESYSAMVALSVLMFESKSMKVAFDDRIGCWKGANFGKRSGLYCWHQNRKSHVGSKQFEICQENSWSSWRVAYYKALQQHTAALCFIFFFCGGFSLFESRGVPHRLCLSLTKAHHFFSFFM